MEKSKVKQKKRGKILWIIGIAMLLAVGFSVYYVNDYYHSNVKAEDFNELSGTVEMSEFEDGIFLDGSGDETAVIFYPGAKVEYTSYLPLFYELSSHGVDCFLVKMPCNLAFFGMNMANGIMKEYEYENWYLSGHSLGGAMAASYSAKHLDVLEGLILLAAYPTESLDAETFSVLSLYGSEDKVLNMQKLEEGRELMPEDYTEICIEGGNHAQFGDYGEQEGDGSASVSMEAQVEQCVLAILNVIEK